MQIPSTPPATFKPSDILNHSDNQTRLKYAKFHIQQLWKMVVEQGDSYAESMEEAKKQATQLFNENPNYNTNVEQSINLITGLRNFLRLQVESDPLPPGEDDLPPMPGSDDLPFSLQAEASPTQTDADEHEGGADTAEVHTQQAAQAPAGDDDEDDGQDDDEDHSQDDDQGDDQDDADDQPLPPTDVSAGGTQTEGADGGEDDEVENGVDGEDASGEEKVDSSAAKAGETAPAEDAKPAVKRPDPSWDANDLSRDGLISALVSTLAPGECLQIVLTRLDTRNVQAAIQPGGIKDEPDQTRIGFKVTGTPAELDAELPDAMPSFKNARKTARELADELASKVAASATATRNDKSKSAAKTVGATRTAGAAKTVAKTPDAKAKPAAPTTGGAKIEVSGQGGAAVSKVTFKVTGEGLSEEQQREQETQGVITLDNLKPGSYKFVINAEDYETYHVSLPIKAGETKEHKINLKAKQPTLI